ncbi:unnamed protein product [Onchocerca ochengi]|uniref:TFIIIC_sub6 domain-containing protein n=1 Tax=Onchocerca ochengi TaxID=42157 RepID=A0A182EVU3_ONCOC|nr:unnamed protein product [Onchocerca ochengi]
MADKPLVETFAIDQENQDRPITKEIHTISPSIHDERTSVIAGQLIIYDLDEEPPIASQLKREKVLLSHSVHLSEELGFQQFVNDY